jgi:nicotinate-nucleotide adenylyltransferase
MSGRKDAADGERRVAFLGGSRVAFFGGSFDPPHKGHLAIARAARTALALDAVLFAPVGAQPLKEQGARASYEDRVAMTRLAIAGEAGFEISLADAPQAQGGPAASPNYSLETLERLHAELGADCRLFFLMGADSFFGLRQWHRAAEITFAAALIVASRPGQPVQDLRAALPRELTLEPWGEVDAGGDAGGDAERGGVMVRGFRVLDPAGRRAEVYLLPGLDEPASASAIRDRMRTAANDAALREWLPAPVAAYVRGHGLYR